jgi:hypothetical protein
MTTCSISKITPRYADRLQDPTLSNNLQGGLYDKVIACATWLAVGTVSGGDVYGVEYASDVVIIKEGRIEPQQAGQARLSTAKTDMLCRDLLAD